MLLFLGESQAFEVLPEVEFPAFPFAPECLQLILSVFFHSVVAILPSLPFSLPALATCSTYSFDDSWNGW